MIVSDVTIYEGGIIFNFVSAHGSPAVPSDATTTWTRTESELAGSRSQWQSSTLRGTLCFHVLSS